MRRKKARSSPDQPTIARKRPLATRPPASSVSPSRTACAVFASSQGNTEPSPAVTVASAGITSPASTRISSPGRRSTARKSTVPSSTTRRPVPVIVASKRSRATSIGRRARRNSAIESAKRHTIMLVRSAASLVRGSPATSHARGDARRRDRRGSEHGGVKFGRIARRRRSLRHERRARDRRQNDACREHRARAARKRETRSKHAAEPGEHQKEAARARAARIDDGRYGR